MKKTMIALILIAAVAAFAAADSQFRLAADFSADFVEKPTVESAMSAFDEGSDILTGFHWEMIINRTGFGMHHMILFERLETDIEEPVYDWTMDWMGDIFLSYHPFGAGAFLDPFFEIGVGNAGRVNIDEDHGEWYKDGEGEWYYQIDESHEDESLTNLGLFTYIGGGMSLDFDGLLVGTRVAYRPWVNPVPGTDVPEYPAKNFQVTLFGGVAFGGH